MIAAVQIAVLIATFAQAQAGDSTATPIHVVNLTDVDLTSAEFLSLQVCAGFHNANSSNGPLVYSIRDSSDDMWLRQLYSDRQWLAVPPNDFMAQCLSNNGNRVLRYDFEKQKIAIPSLVTIATALRLIPMENTTGFIVGFDALAEFGVNVTAITVTRYAFDNFVNETTSLAITDPGYVDAGSRPLHPSLTGEPNLNLIDFVVKERLFNMYMVEMCVPGTDEHQLMQDIVSNNPWPVPVPVYGYNDAIPLFGGDTFEADTTCTSAFNMGAIATGGVYNLAFFSAIRAPISIPLVQNPDPSPPITYNASKTYVSWVIGDGDNINYIEHGKKDDFAARMAACHNTSFPLSWTISPHLHRLAPDILEWYYNQSRHYGCDYFMLPPSGYLYSYPGLMPGHVQDEYLRQTEHLCTLYNTTATIDWEVAGTWSLAIDQYVPKYATNHITHGLYPVNVPYPFPVLEFGPKEYFKVVGGNTVIFKPREWRGTGGSSPFKKEYVTVAEMAAEINGYDKGTVTWAYMTSDGGAHWPLFEQVAVLLDPHVEVVNANTLSDLALQSTQING
eukprot:TRINITY_DN7748_c0_g1_i1.p1 TRINITY_DN7748_c0_g1~~TRINITY_DN7748_c0_g1_i1.p1  ORF type:complete len:559 (+),score=93.81 TRINITY_DN7748_c0_g1_i1:49-1725(+)